jgi:adenylate cyclase
MNAEYPGQTTILNPIAPPKLFIKANGSVETLTLTGRTVWTFGRSKKSTVQLDDPNASRVHAQLAIYPDQSCYFVDLKSRNGTLVNGEPAVTPKLLNHGDRIAIGNTVLVFEKPLQRDLEKASTCSEARVFMLHASAAQAAFW